jgi:hypothetical protein
MALGIGIMAFMKAVEAICLFLTKQEIVRQVLAAKQQVF